MVGRTMIIEARYSREVTSGLSSNNKKKRILFVDDKLDVTQLLRIALERAGFDVDTFNIE